MKTRFTHLRELRALATLLMAALPMADSFATPEEPPDVLYVDARRGSDKSPGSRTRPLRSLSAAIARLPDPLHKKVVIEMTPGSHTSTGSVGMPESCLQLMRRMSPDVQVELRGSTEKPTILAWHGARRMVHATEGRWLFENLQIGTFETDQRRGVEVVGPAQVILEDVRLRLRGETGEAILATRGGLVRLRGTIALNEHLHDEAPDDSFSGILATDHGVVEFDDSDGSLDLGNGTLSVRYYGQIRLGCESARITSWTTSNNLAINSGGRIDLRGTHTTLHAPNPRNTPIGLEHDGHLLAEDAHVTITGENHSAIALQKSSTFTCNDIDLEGTFPTTIWASSGSMFVGRFLGDVTKIRATTGAGIYIEKVGGEVKGPVEALSGATVSLPDRVVRGD